MNIFCRNKDKLDESKRMPWWGDSSKPPSRSHGDATEQLLDKSNQSLQSWRERGCLAFVMEKIQGQNKLCVMYLISI
ncbi:hypothetical protein YC2023_064281 [Brassica napus]|uniref:(rape) hypothetical protein n=1 Tax=Brassica napus TaxID=3708 RepID=A0A816T7B6_BRANA|nr:unnamed protein product [Brassica napus]